MDIQPNPKVQPAEEVQTFIPVVARDKQCGKKQL